MLSSAHGEAQRRRGSCAVMTWRSRVLAAVAVFGAILGGRFALGKPLGEACSDAFLCNALPARCLFTRGPTRGDGFCTKPCADAACPEGWSCAAIAVEQSDGSSLGAEPICVRPEDDPAELYRLKFKRRRD